MWSLLSRHPCPRPHRIDNALTTMSWRSRCRDCYVVVVVSSTSSSSTTTTTTTTPHLDDDVAIAMWSSLHRCCCRIVHVHVHLVFGLGLGRGRERESKEAMAQCAQSCVLYRRFRTLSPMEGKDVQGGDCATVMASQWGVGERGRARWRGRARARAWVRVWLGAMAMTTATARVSDGNSFRDLPRLRLRHRHRLHHPPPLVLALVDDAVVAVVASSSYQGRGRRGRRAEGERLRSKRHDGGSDARVKMAWEGSQQAL